MKRFNLLFFILCLCSCLSPGEKVNKQINVPFEKALSFREKNENDSAFYYFAKAQDLAIIQNDSLTIGKCFVNLAIISTNKRDDLVGQELSLKALSFLDVKNKYHFLYLSHNYNNLGNASQNLRDYDEAAKFYDLAIKFSTKSSDSITFLNNKAYLYQETKQYKKALLTYGFIEQNSIKSQIDYARILSNISYTKWLLNPKYDPSFGLLKALNIRKKENDLWGQNSSYYYLANYYGEHKPDSALYFAHQMHSVARKLKSNDDQLYALQQLIKHSKPSQKNEYFERYLKLDDSAQNLRNTVKNQFALIRYRVEENKAENLKLLEENTSKKYQLIILSLLGILFLISGILLYKKRKERIVLEAQNTINEHQLKTSKKVHDVVANGLYTIMTKLDNREAFKDDPIVDEMEELYEKSRNISYEKNVPSEPRFNEKLSELLKSFESNKTEVLISGNEEKMWMGLSNKITFELEHTLQELMVNMKKHSQASKVIIKFEKLNNQIHISYIDNGKGIKDFSPGNGLTNTETRIKSIAGLITFDTKPNEGLKVNISFPI